MNALIKFMYIPKAHFNIYNEYLNAYRKKINRIPFYIRRTGNSTNTPGCIVFRSLKRKNVHSALEIAITRFLTVVWDPRSQHLPSDNLPVFLKYKNNKNLVVTVIRKIKGNKEVLKREIESICNSNVIEKTDCWLIKGNHKKKIKDVMQN